MPFYQRKFFPILLLAAGSLIAGANQALAAPLSFISDTIDNSAPATSTNHLIQFTTVSQIPSSGKITIIFQKNAFKIPAELDYTDIDLAVNETEKTLAQTPGSGSDSPIGVEISTTTNSIIFTLNDTDPINASSSLKIKIGSNAVFQTQGDQKIINPENTGSYKIDIKTKNASDDILDDGQARIAIVLPVSTAVTDWEAPERFNGLPTGEVAPNTTAVEVSLETNEYAFCRYATTAGQSYDSMSRQFTFTNSGRTFHSFVAAVQGPASYEFYVRCRDWAGNKNNDDYLISFSVPAPQPTPAPGAGTGAGGGGGGAPFPPPPGSPEVVIEGWAYPRSSITLLKDGKTDKTTEAGTDAKFNFILNQLTPGVYTIGIWARDTEGRRSITQSVTFTAVADAKTVIKVFLPPSLTVVKDQVVPGETIQITGQSAPQSEIETWLFPQTEKDQPKNIIKTMATTTSQGKWEVLIGTDNLKIGTYIIKARTKLKDLGSSEFGQLIYVGVGQPALPDLRNRADLNRDGRVNLVDFSILLFHWNSDDAVADINLDGRVNLADFSIMMYYWTG